MLGLTLISKFLIACIVMYLSQITAASDWSRLFCTVVIVVLHITVFCKIKLLGIR